MIKDRSLLLTFLLVFFFISTVVAQQNNSSSTGVRNVNVRRPPAEKIQEYAQSEEFNYGVAKNPKSIWDKIRVWLWQQLKPLLFNEVTSHLLKLAFYLLIAFIIFLLVKNAVGAQMFQSQSKQPIGLSIKETVDEPADLEKQIRQAIQANHYNIAIRLLYKKSLQQLQNNGWINWKKNKTNHDYIYEIKNKKLQHMFRDVTWYYEFAQYGNFNIENDRFEKVHRRFKKMEAIIKSSA